MDGAVFYFDLASPYAYLEDVWLPSADAPEPRPCQSSAASPAPLLLLCDLDKAGLLRLRRRRSLPTVCRGVPPAQDSVNRSLAEPRAVPPGLFWSGVLPPTLERGSVMHQPAMRVYVAAAATVAALALAAPGPALGRPVATTSKHRLLGEPLRPTTGGRPERKRGGEMARRSHRSETRSLATVSRRAQKLAPARKLLVCRDRRRSSENTRPLSRSGSLCSSLCRLGWSRHRSATSSVVRPIRCGGARCSGAWPV